MCAERNRRSKLRWSRSVSSHPSNSVTQCVFRQRDRHSGERDRGWVLRILILCRLAFSAVFSYLELNCFEQMGPCQAAGGPSLIVVD
jgi:hypothetical protein